MSESLVEAAPAIENKMGEPDARLGVSVSFGRFGNDTLSWEKWSYFSQNKYLEEAGNLSTPGLVAQKKAYFEAHYKKIAAQKAMELEQEKAMEHAGRSSEEPMVEGILEDSSGIDDKSVTCDGDIGRETCGIFSTNAVIDDDVKDGDSGSIREAKPGACADRLIDKPDDKSITCNGEVSEEEIGRETCGTFSTNLMIDDEVKDDHSEPIRVAKQGACADHQIDKAGLGGENEGAVLEINEEVLSGNGVVPGSNVGEEVTLVAAENPQDDLPKTPPENEGSREQPTVLGKKCSKSNARDIARKATTAKRTTDRVASPVVRNPQASTPRNSRPRSDDFTKSVPCISKKKANESPFPEIMHIRVGESKSMIMGDKDIVKRASKTSQSRCKGSLSSGKCSSSKQAPFEPKISTFPTPRNENKGLQKSQAPDRKNAIGVSPFLRSDERAEKRKEFLKNLKAKSITREAENAERRAKVKEEKESEIKKLRQSLNFKATPMPSFFGSRGKGHSHLQKEGVVDNKIRHRPPASNR